MTSTPAAPLIAPAEISPTTDLTQDPLFGAVAIVAAEDDKDGEGVAEEDEVEGVSIFGILVCDTVDVYYLWIQSLAS